MPKLIIQKSVTSNGNTSEDIIQKFNIGVTSDNRHLTSNIGEYQNYYLYILL